MNRHLNRLVADRSLCLRVQVLKCSNAEPQKLAANRSFAALGFTMTSMQEAADFTACVLTL